MMTFGTGGSGWLSMLAGLGLIAGVVLVVIWVAQWGGARPEDESARTLRTRFARGEIDAVAFEEMRRVLESTVQPRAGTRIGLIGLVLIVGAILVGVLGGWLGPAGWGPGGMVGPGAMVGPGGMMGPGGMGPMMGVGAGPTAPTGTSVRMAGTRFEPPVLTIRVGETVRWFNDDALPHTVSAGDGSWDSGNLAPGGSFERRFDAPGSYPYLCRYHPGMVGMVEVRAT